VLLNITPDHLDRYDDFDAYEQSKLRLFAMQSFGRVAVDVSAQSKVRDLLSRAGILYLPGGKYRYPQQAKWPALQGPHNLQNVWAAHVTCTELGLSDQQVYAALKTFPGLPHRMERVAERNGIIFVNDSKATNPTATAPALAAFPAIRWICGGRPKGDDLDECEPHFGHVRSAYTIGEAAELFERLLKPHMPVKNCRELEVAVKAAADDAEAGDTVLLSPACASFDQFKDFEERGDRFRELVGAL
jgi:UDP-N-acetylmuramoylalanine--D-glutamate ligase